MSDQTFDGVQDGNGNLARQAIAAVSWMGMSGIATVLAGLIVVPVLARIYPPAAWGHFAVFQVGAGILALFLTARLELGLPLLPSASQAALHRFLALVVGGATVAFCGLFLLADHNGLLPAGALAIPLGAGLMAILSTLSLRLTAQARFGQLAILEGAAILTPMVFQVVLALGAMPTGSEDLQGLILGQIGGLVVVLAGGHIWVFAGRPKPEPPLPPILPILHRLRSYPRNSLPASIIVVGRERLLTLVAMAFLSPAAVGQIALAQRLAVAPAALVGNAVRPVVFGLAGRSGQIGTGKLALWYLIGVIPLLGAMSGAVSALSEPILRVILGPGWNVAAQAFSALVLVVPARAAAAGLSRLFDLSDRQKHAARLEFGFVLTLIVTLVLIGFTATAQLLWIGFSVVSAVYFLIFSTQALNSTNIPGYIPALATVATVMMGVLGYLIASTPF